MRAYVWIVFGINVDEESYVGDEDRRKPFYNCMFSPIALQTPSSSKVIIPFLRSASTMFSQNAMALSVVFTIKSATFDNPFDTCVKVRGDSSTVTKLLKPVYNYFPLQKDDLQGFLLYRCYTNR